MKLFKGIGLGLLIGLGVGIAIALIVLFIPGFEFVWLFLKCFCSCGGGNSSEVACAACDKFLSCEGGVANFQYFNTIAYSVLISTGIGTLWGIAATTKSANEKAKIKKEKNELARKERYNANNGEILTELSSIIAYTEACEKELHKNVSNVKYSADEKKYDIEIALQNFKKKQAETEELMNNSISKKI